MIVLCSLLLNVVEESNKNVVVVVVEKCGGSGRNQWKCDGVKGEKTIEMWWCW